MAFTVRIETDGAAFDGHDEYSRDIAAMDAIPRMLREVATLVANGINGETIYDTDGNAVGSFNFTTNDE